MALDITSAITITLLMLTSPSNSLRSPAGEQVEPQYVITALESLGGDSYYSSHPSAINNRGLIVGRASARNGTDMACVWTGGHAKELGSLPNYYGSAAFAVNEKGWIVGVLSGNNHPEIAVLWKDRRVIQIGGRGWFRSTANSINERGEIVGEAMDGEDWFLYVYRSGRIDRLPVPKGCMGSAEGINNRGTIAGTIYGSKKAPIPGIWENGRIKTLGTLGGTNSDAYAINQLGDVVGSSSVFYGESQHYHGFLWSDGKMTDLGSLGGGYSTARAINNKRQVVGESLIWQSEYRERAFLYADGQMYNLNDKIAPDSGWVLHGATGINDRGEIVGYGHYKDREVGFLLTPSSLRDATETR